jgi:AcrR family transcriptional regulator
MLVSGPSPKGRVRRGRRPRALGSPRDDILRAALFEFGQWGFDGASMRAIAARADTNPALAYHYFGSKERLFREALSYMMRSPESAPVAAIKDPHKAALVIVRVFLDRWDDSGTSMAFAGLLRSALTNEKAAEALRSTIEQQITPQISARSGNQFANRRVALIASTLLGLGLCRYVLRLPGMYDASPNDIARWTVHAITQYLTGPLK